VENDRECVDAVRWALELGYRHIDTAQAYGNEGSVGQGLRESGVPRGEVFITTKFFPGRKDPVAEARHSLQRLGVDYECPAIDAMGAAGACRDRAQARVLMIIGLPQSMIFEVSRACRAIMPAGAGLGRVLCAAERVPWR
jgi:hypothetical protein